MFGGSYTKRIAKSSYNPKKGGCEARQYPIIDPHHDAGCTVQKYITYPGIEGEKIDPDAANNGHYTHKIPYNLCFSVFF